MRVLDPYRGYWREVPDVPERRDVTVCIAAVCEEAAHRSKIVICSDRKASSALGSAETMVKIRRIAEGWQCLTSGSDTEINSLLLLLRKGFSGKNPDETNALEFVRSALNERMRER